MPRILINLMRLTRIYLMAVVALTGVMGFVIFRGGFDWEVLWVFAGITFLGSSLSALNQIQEKDHDARMERTKNRPLPTGEMDLLSVIFVTMLFGIAGLYCLTATNRNFLPILSLVIIALVCYNIIYTYLKPHTNFAILPGSIVGGVPPALGWCMAGGLWWDQTIWAIGLYFILWQVPHFWLIMFCRNAEYKEAGFVTITDDMPSLIVRRLTFTWIAAAALFSLYMALALDYHLYIKTVVMLASLWIVRASIFLMREAVSQNAFRPAFARFNMFNLCVILAGLANACI
ncbi:MAG: UbiA family prenyltransferase [Planctomycetes bacterium]|nr:UbiA family prenyltransferase [Planctomycetota bacterium]